MVSNSIDRFNGLVASLAIKAPCAAVAIANITLSGEQTVNGVAVVSGDRVLVTAQTSSVDNGIYDVSSSAWARAADFDGNRDVVSGTFVTVATATVGRNPYYQVTTANPITIGTTAINFTLADGPNVSYALTDAEIAEGLTDNDIIDSYEPGNILRYGENATPGTTVMTTAIQNAFDSNNAVFFPYEVFLSGAVTAAADRVITGPGTIKAEANMAASSILLSTSNDNVVIDGLQVDGNVANQINTVHTLGLGDDAANGTIRNCHIFNASGSGIVLSGSGHDVHHNHIHDTTNNAIQAAATDAHDIFDLRITHNHIHDIGSNGGGIEFDDGTHDCLISNNLIYDVGEQAIQVEQGAYNCTVTENKVYWTTVPTATQSGIFVGLPSTSRTPTLNTRNVIVSNNRLRNCYNGVFVDTATEVTVTGNEAFECSHDGIRLSSLDFAVISNNRCINNGFLVANRYGISAAAMTFSSVVGNVVVDTESGASRTQEFGMIISDGSNVIWGNIVENVINMPYSMSGPTNFYGGNIGHPSAQMEVSRVNNFAMSGAKFYSVPGAFANADTTPDVSTNNNWTTNNSSSGNITSFDGGSNGMTLTVVGADGGNTTLVDGSLLQLAGGVNFTLADGDTITLIRSGGVFYEKARSVN